MNADEYPPAPVPERPTLPRLRDAATACHPCSLAEHATQVEADRASAMQAFVDDLATVAEWLPSA